MSKIVNTISITIRGREYACQVDSDFIESQYAKYPADFEITNDTLHYMGFPVSSWLFGDQNKPTECIDGNKFNLCKSNIREIQLANGKRKTSKFPGVSKCGDRWRARAFKGGALIHCGMHDTEAQAVAAREKMLADLDSMRDKTIATKVTGIYLKHGFYYVDFRYKGQRVSGGRYKTREAAERAKLMATRAVDAR